MGFVDKWPSRMQGQSLWVFQSRAGGSFWWSLGGCPWCSNSLPPKSSWGATERPPLRSKEAFALRLCANFLSHFALPMHDAHWGRCICLLLNILIIQRHLLLYVTYIPTPQPILAIGSGFGELCQPISNWISQSWRCQGQDICLFNYVSDYMNLEPNCVNCWLTMVSIWWSHIVVQSHCNMCLL